MHVLHGCFSAGSCNVLIAEHVTPRNIFELGTGAEGINMDVVSRKREASYSSWQV